jgi:hypothetical protein
LNRIIKKTLLFASKKYVLKPSAGKLAVKINSFVALLFRPGIFFVASEIGISLKKRKRLISFVFLFYFITSAKRINPAGSRIV